MKKTVGYSKTFIVAGEWEKIWTDEEMPDGSTTDDKRKKWYELRNEVHKFHFESNKAAEKQKQSEEMPIVGNLINDIRTCKDIKVLETYKILVKNKPDLEAAYNSQFKKLTQ